VKSTGPVDATDGSVNSSVVVLLGRFAILPNEDGESTVNETLFSRNAIRLPNVWVCYNVRVGGKQKRQTGN
jgi:hypothetical protein